MSNDKQISIEWFFNQLVAHRIIVMNGTTYWDKVKTKYEILLEQAKAMHKEEIENAYREGWMENIRCKHTPNRYYNETYGDGKQ